MAQDALGVLEGRPGEAGAVGTNLGGTEGQGNKGRRIGKTFTLHILSFLPSSHYSSDRHLLSPSVPGTVLGTEGTQARPAQL